MPFLITKEKEEKEKKKKKEKERKRNISTSLFQPMIFLLTYIPPIGQNAEGREK
jgi:hypothetical protein